MKHLEYCNQKGRIITESEWVLDVLNAKLPPGDKLSNGTVNQWMNGGRQPDSHNIVRLIQVFGPEVMPHVGIPVRADLIRLMSVWDDLSEEERQKINDMIPNPEDGKELAPLQV
jgi:hypothetical protein